MIEAIRRLITTSTFQATMKYAFLQKKTFLCFGKQPFVKKKLFN